MTTTFLQEKKASMSIKEMEPALFDNITDTYDHGKGELVQSIAGGIC